MSVLAELFFELIIGLLDANPRKPGTGRKAILVAVVLLLLIGLVVGFVWWRNR